MVAGLILGFSGAYAQRAASLSAESIIQEHLGIFQVVDELLDPFERVEEKDGQITVWFRSRLDAKNQNKKICDGARWLITGRLGAATGSNALFRKNPEVKGITLVFFDVETSVKLGKKNRYRQSRRLVEHARFNLTRKRGLSLDATAVRQALAQKNCHAVVPELLSTLKVSRP
jgi:hypothetical protein